MAFAPALLVAAFAFWCGSFAGGAAFPGGPLGQLLILLAALFAATAWSDPLELGRAGRWLCAALLVAVAGSLLASPVPRAGRVGVMLLPAFLLLPAFVARCWSLPGSRTAGVRALAVAQAAVAIASLLAPSRGVLGRAAMPLGHHNLLASFLVILTPIVALGLKRSGADRLLASAALVATVAAVVASRSWWSSAVLALVAIAGTRRFERARPLAFGLGLIGLALLVPRGAAMLAGSDSSLAARSTYARAAWRGFLERPLLGWGPGSTGWTIALTARPVPGVNPAGEVVGEAHSLPLQLLRELGASGVALGAAIGAIFLWRRLRARRHALDPVFVEAGCLSLGAGLATGLSGAWLAVPALPLALALGAGTALSGSAKAGPTNLTAWPARLYVAAAIALLLPLAVAHSAYQRAARSVSRAEAAPHLERAIAWDPDFPLYRARWAWAAAAPAERRSTESARAARQAGGVAALWLRAGVDALEAGDRRLAAESFSQALRLDPLSAFAPFQLAPLAEDPAGCAARAFLAEPRLAAAVLFRDRESARRAAIGRAREWPAVDAGWRERFAAEALAISFDGSKAADLTLSMDMSPALALSLHAFRRSPWPADIARIPIERAAARKLDGLPSASAMRSSSAAAFPLERCRP